MANIFADWRFSQSFGDDNSSDDDLVTALAFDRTGDHLAVGDKAGRICIFEARPAQQQQQQLQHPSEGKQGALGGGYAVDWAFLSEFQSHEPEFDCLKSIEIEEKINQVVFARRQRNGLFVLASNDKTIKLFKVHEKRVFQQQQQQQENMELGERKAAVGSAASSAVAAVANGGGAAELKLPPVPAHQRITTATCKRVFANAHSYHVSSISLCSDGQTFISADDLRIQLWSLDVSDESFTLVDVKPANLEELTEVITSATFHPTDCSTLMYSSSRGAIRLCDLRDSALCDQHAKQFEVEEDPANKSFFSEIISSVSDAKFTADGRYIVARDYMSVRIFDVNMEREPLAVIPVHGYLKSHLCSLYENDSIFDKFEVSSSPDGKQFVTGSYGNRFSVLDPASGQQLGIEALKDPPRRRKGRKGGGAPKQDVPNVSQLNFNKKALHVAWHPRADIIAMAGLNRLYIYTARQMRQQQLAQEQQMMEQNLQATSQAAQLPQQQGGGAAPMES